jgi:RNA polymerase sigma-70 factor (ECF subfamily)
VAKRSAEHPPHPELARARAGDVDAFLELVAEHDRELRALAFRLLGDREAMDDVLQEAFAKAFRALGSFRGGSSLRTWLYRIVYNACVDELRRRRPTLPLQERDAVTSADAEQAEIARLDLASALASLPADLRATVLLVDAEGFDYAEAGRVLGIPAGTVGSRLSRAHRALRAALAADREELEHR